MLEGWEGAAEGFKPCERVGKASSRKDGPHLDQPLFAHSGQKIQKISFASFRFHFVFTQDGISELVDSSGLPQQIPNHCTDGV
jgi:hypothetical protein